MATPQFILYILCIHGCLHRKRLIFQDTNHRHHRQHHDASDDACLFFLPSALLHMIRFLAQQERHHTIVACSGCWHSSWLKLVHQYHWAMRTEFKSPFLGCPASSSAHDQTWYDNLLMKFVRTKISMAYMHVLRREVTDMDWPESHYGHPDHEANMRTAFVGRLIKARTDGLCICLLYTSPSPRDQRGSRMPSSA